MYGKQIENVENFKYLGGEMLTDTGNSKKVILKKLEMMTNEDKLILNSSTDSTTLWFFQLCCMAVKAELYCKNLRRR